MTLFMPARRFRQRRLWVFVVLVVALLGALLGRLATVQIGQRDDYVRAAQRVNTRVIVQPAVRGRILDTALKPLAGNTFVASVTVEGAALLAAGDGGRGLIRRVAALFGMPFAQLWGATHLCGTTEAPSAPRCFNGEPYQAIPIARGVDSRRALSLLEQPENFPGIAVVAEPVRSYPYTDTPGQPCSGLSRSRHRGRRRSYGWADRRHGAGRPVRSVASVAVPPCPSTPGVLSQA